MAEPEEKIEVNAAALYQILNALNNEYYLIRELQVTTGMPGNPITSLTKEYNDWATKLNDN